MEAHEPVLREAFLVAVAPQAGQRWVDGTFGRGGHTAALLEAGAEVLALDQDEAAEQAAKKLSRRYAGLTWRHSNFEHIEQWTEEQGWDGVDGVLLDLGVSSPQLETAERGFSFRADGPLDMRMDRQQSATAADIINTWAEEDLANLFYEHGGERHSRRIARSLCRDRAQHPFARTQQLADAVASALGRRRPQRLHPATKVFQALRIAVNREQDVLLGVLPTATRLMNPQGHLAIISFHSGEDRIVKDYFRKCSALWLDIPGQFEPAKNPEHYYDNVRRFMPDDAELEKNPRARSARLRVGRRTMEPVK